MNFIFSQKLKVRTKLSYSALIIAVLVFFVDQLTKYLTYHFIPHMDSYVYWYPYGGIGIFKNFLGIDFSLNYMTNKGAAWGVLGDYQIFLIVMRLVLIVVMTSYLLFFNRQPSWQIPLVLIVSGALGNVFDFFMYGHVVDMLHFVFWGYDFPVFNLADSAISTGIAILFFLSWTES
jgi:signal peptidase II